MTGYYFTLPIAATYQDLLAYSDGCSGKLWLTDKFGEGRQQEFDLFHVDIPDSVLAIAAPLRYTDSYFEPFIAIFHQYIEMIKLDKQGIHCLIRNGKSAVKKRMISTSIVYWTTMVRWKKFQYKAGGRR